VSREAWLSSDDPEKFAAAAIKCQHAGGFCMADGFCHFDGACFRSPRAAIMRAVHEIKRAAGEQPADVAIEMLTAANLLLRTVDLTEAEA